MGRSRSASSASSGSNSSYDRKGKKDKKDKKEKKDKKGKKEKEDKKDKKDKHADKDGHSFGTSEVHAQQMHQQMPLMPSFDNSGFPQPPGFPQTHDRSTDSGSFQSPANAPPPSGYRVPLTTTSAFPSQQAGQPPCQDADGSPIFIGSALFENSVHPCKIGPHLSPPCMVPYGGQEYAHHGRYDLLPFDPNIMELVPTSRGEIPAGRRPIEGGYEEDGSKLYHAVANVQGLKVPGKTGPHLDGCNVSFGGAELVINDRYDILCWRN
ncbi:hypothetical protein E1B28_011281 [Marasmius oreades]|uniref:Uncharacterized protein n=1 Tax=Marasmius oreades TaxID=181124 RepID=A0A9P7UQ18_9AGAR|nr:uncharacterized protein E1B28_011281 [Marasmius oreades]KAG7089615.1 hypothetical protein E1B28_011281 [Marasmius oreades]